MNGIRETGTIAINGFVLLALLLAGGIFAVANIDIIIAWIESLRGAIPLDLEMVAIAVGVVLFVTIVPSFVVNNPNESIVILFFGRYIGTLKRAGFFWILPFTTHQKVSRRVVSLNTKTLKVNDSRGNPIEIGAVIVWNVEDSARAALNVDNYHDFVAIQSETSVRTLASRYPYDADDGIESLRGSQEQIAAELKAELQNRLAIAGVNVSETRLSHLAYAPEIASAMLRRQQAEAVVSARRIITENAVKMADAALTDIEIHSKIKLDDNAKARLISNLLITLVSERDPQPTFDLNP
jgi:regulator of protease activity HflC (stomatin/prohibitin superfamily)